MATNTTHSKKAAGRECGRVSDHRSILTLRLYVWAKDVADGKHVKTRRASRQTVVDAIEGVLGVIGPGGAERAT